uniref:Uncharacterized protein n=1 Tax=Heterorhabditis bacteriophora TaxID=37862 RepID=A0A1I7XTV3_HETBA
MDIEPAVPQINRHCPGGQKIETTHKERNYVPDISPWNKLELDVVFVRLEHASQLIRYKSETTRLNNIPTYSICNINKEHR